MTGFDIELMLTLIETCNETVKVLQSVTHELANALTVAHATLYLESRRREPPSRS